MSASTSERAVTPKNADAAEAEERWFSNVRAGLQARKLVPYLGAGLLGSSAPVPSNYEALAAYIGSKVALPRRARGNAWAAAQFVESRQHRSSVTALMRAAFAAEVEPRPFHRFLAELAPPLIVDTWYDAALRKAFAERGQGYPPQWAEVQGITRAGIGEARWYRAYDPAGEELTLDQASAARTLIYKPHGGIQPSGNFLITDADYVEVLTEIDIQSPIPPVVQTRRSELGFLYLGCRFNDQLLRIYARQIQKRSAGPHFAVFESEPTRMERRFALEFGLSVIRYPLESALERIMAG